MNKFDFILYLFAFTFYVAIFWVMPACEVSEMSWWQMVLLYHTAPVSFALFAAGLVAVCHKSTVLQGKGVSDE